MQIIWELLLERGDTILCEEYTYPSVIESVMVPKGYKALAVDLDQDGMLPESLQQVHHTALSIIACSLAILSALAAFWKINAQLCVLMEGLDYFM